MATATLNALPSATSSSQVPAPGAAGAVVSNSSTSQLSLVTIPSTSSLSLHTLRRAKAFKGQSLSPKRQFSVRADYSERRSGGGGGDFFTGFLLGGVLFGAIGYMIAPAVRQSIAEAEKEAQEDEAEGPPKKLPQYVDDDEGLESTRKSLNEKIAQLNAAIDDVSAQLRADDVSFGGINESAVELESAA